MAAETPEEHRFAVPLPPPLPLPPTSLVTVTPVTPVTPRDMSLTDAERRRRTAFYAQIARLRAESRPVMECERCLLLFSDAILHQMHVSMHTAYTWQCSMCSASCSDRRHFQEHTVTQSHSVLPSTLRDGGGVPPLFFPPPGGVPSVFHVGTPLPDLASLCSPAMQKALDDILKSVSRDK